MKIESICHTLNIVKNIGEKRGEDVEVKTQSGGEVEVETQRG